MKTRTRLARVAAAAAVITVFAAAGVAVLEAKDCLTAGETDPVMLALDPYLIDALRGGASGTGGRFGPDGGMADLMTEGAFTDLVAAHDLQVFSGPVIGNITATSATFWVRTAGTHQVQVVVGTDAAFSNPVTSAAVTTVAADDFTVELPVTGLNAYTEYHYDVLLDAASRQGPTYPTFRTAPASGQAVAFSVGFGGGARYNPPKETIWASIETLDPLAFLFMGDNVYIDMPTRRDVQRLMYYRRQLRGEYKSFAAKTAIYSIWDDHDFATDDSAGGLDPFAPAWKVPVWDVYCENFVNPSYGGGAAKPGCWYEFTLGDVQFFMTDGRYYRDYSAGTMLGPDQKAWLLDALSSSTATFKVLVSGTLWTEYADKGGADSWWGVPAEREEILGLVDRERIGGVILLAADRHRTEIWKLVRPNGGYDLHEFVSSKLTNDHTHATRVEAEWSYNTGNFFGMLDFDFFPADPTVTFRAVQADGTEIHTFTLARSELESGGVYVTAGDARAHESGDTATFRVGRSPVTASPLDVSVEVLGTATLGVDYTGLAGTVTISAGAAYATVTVTPIDDTIDEPSETIVVNVVPTVPSTYTVGRPSSITIDLADDDGAPTGLVLHYRLDETTGAQALDSSPSGIDGTVNSDTAPTWTTGNVGGALQFVEAEHVFVDAGDPVGGDLDFGTTGDFSIAAWVKAAAAPADQYTIVGKGDGGGNPRLLVKIDAAGHVMFTIRDTTITGTAAVTDDQWHHVAVACDRDLQACVYVDAALDATGGLTTTQDVSSAVSFFVGKSGNDRRYMEGLIDEVKVFAVALDAAEVTVLKDMGPSPLVASVTPSTGPASGGTPVTVAGTNFAAGATVTFGTSAGVNTVVVDAASITTATPAGTGTVDVTVTNADTQSATLAGGFTYDGAPGGDGSSSGCAAGAGRIIAACLGVALLLGTLAVLRRVAGKRGRQGRPVIRSSKSEGGRG